MRSFLAGVRSCYDEGKRTAETLAMDYHRGADVQVNLLEGRDLGWALWKLIFAHFDVRLHSSL